MNGPILVQIGQIVTGELLEGSEVSYVFEATEGQEIHLTFSNASGEILPILLMYDINGEEILNTGYYKYSFGYGYAYLRDIEIQESGVYSFVVRSAVGQGEYTLAVYETVSDVVTGHLGNEANAYLVVFHAVDGQQFRVTLADLGQNELRIEIIDNRGVFVMQYTKSAKLPAADMIFTTYGNIGYVQIGVTVPSTNEDITFTINLERLSEDDLGESA